MTLVEAAAGFPGLGESGRVRGVDPRTVPVAKRDFQAVLARGIVVGFHEEPNPTRSEFLVSVAELVDATGALGLCDALQVVSHRYGNAVTVEALRTLMDRATPSAGAPLRVSLRELQAA
jgi:hypothetical protein